jgi:GNAT superfamily N-acetyltransferase
MSSPQHDEADVVLRDGSTVHVRPVRDTDAMAVRAFFERLVAGVDHPAVLLHLPRPRPRGPLGHRDRRPTPLRPDRHRRRRPRGRPRRLGTEPDRPERAEIAFAIADAMQHNGLGTILLGQLTQAADQAGVAVLTAEVLPQNHRMLHVVRDSGFPLITHALQA